MQLDVKTTYPDGSVKMAVLTLERPDLAAGESVGVSLVRSAPLAAPELNLGAALRAHEFTVDLIGTDGTVRHVDVLDALQDALADGTASFWMSGPLATQARVEVALEGSQRLVFDVTAYEGGGLAVEASFNNDGAMGASGGRVNYTAVARLDGDEVLRETVSQAQYQNWHRSFSTNEVDGGQGLGSAEAGWLNIRHDVEYLSSTGAVAHYDTSIELDPAMLKSWATTQAAADWGEPLAANGVTKYMPMTGGRADIGIVTGANTAWLISGDAEVAAYALGQAEAAGAVPWNYWDAANGTWLNTDNYPKLWTDVRGGTGTPGNSGSTGLTQQVPWDTGWSGDRAHQPELSFVPYLLTGERWILDNLSAQASYNVVTTWPAVRGNGDDILVRDSQVRGAAWALREIENAAWAAPDGSTEKAYFASVADANWTWLVSQIPTWTAMQGEAHGWVPGVAGSLGDLSPWQQDYFASTTIAAASRGNADAMTFLKWQSNFLVGRFAAEEKGFVMHDGAAYHIAISDTAGSTPYTSWAKIGAETARRGWSNGEDGWGQSTGEYPRLAMATLAGIYHLTGSEAARDAYEALAADSPPNTTLDAYGRAPQYAVTIPGIYGGTVLGTEANDTRVLTSATQNLVADLGDGTDSLALAAGDNKGTVRNVENLVGNAGKDHITLDAPAASMTVDLAAGTDTLILSSKGTNNLTVRNVETVTGGKATDRVTLGAPATGITVDLGEGKDGLTLSSAGSNELTVRNVETVTGGKAADKVTLGAPAVGATVDLGGGADGLILASGGPNSLTVANTETVKGGTAADGVTLASVPGGAIVDLGGGADRLILSGKADTRIVVSNTEAITGGAGADDVTLMSYASGAAIDLGGGADRLTLNQTSGNRLTVSGVETLFGGAGTDDVTLGAAIKGASYDLRGGFDRITLAAGHNVIATTGVETVLGADGADEVTFGGVLTGGSVTLGAGNDALTISGAVSGLVVNLGDGGDRLLLSGAGPNRVIATGVETITGGSAADDVTLTTSPSGLAVDLGGGADRLVLSNAGGTARISNTETLLGGTSADDVTLGAAAKGAVVNLGGGLDRLTLSSAGANLLTVTGTETILGGSANDDVLLGAASGMTTIDLGGGADRLTLTAATGSSVTVSGTETIIGGSGAEAVTLGAAIQGATLDLGGNMDRLTLSSAGTNRVTVLNTETILGGSAADQVTLGMAASGISVNLGDGADKLVLSSTGANRLTVSSTETVLGGSAADDVFLTLARDVSVDLGGGADRLTLANGAGNRVSVAHVETVLGGNGVDEVTLTAPANGAVINLGANSDRLVLGARGNRVTIGDTETVIGGSGADVVTISTGLANGAVDLGGGTDRLVLSSFGTTVTVTNTEEIVGGNGNDRITVTGSAGARIEGGAGADVLTGGRGADLLSGGSGADRFVFTAGSSAPGAADRITDFDANGDLLLFQGMRTGNFTFLGAGAFTHGGHSEARFLDATDQLQVDANGDGSADTVVTLTGVSLAQLSASDFVWS